MNESIKREILKLIVEHNSDSLIDYSVLGHDEVTYTNALKELVDEGSVVGYKHEPTLTEIKRFFVVNDINVTDYAKKKYNLV